MYVVSAFALCAIALPLCYLFLLVLGAMRRVRTATSRGSGHRFAIAIPAHDEGTVIGRTVIALHKLDYQADRFDLHVVADHCSDDTARAARKASALCFERSEGPRSGKAAALGWLFERMWEAGAGHDAVVVFDADTQVDKGFLRAMDARLEQGEQVIQ